MKSRRSNIWCIVQEPPDPCFRWIANGLPHYSRLLTQDTSLRDPKVFQTHGSLPWHVDRSYDELKAMPLPADGSVRQFGETSVDFGTTWQASFDFTYKPSASSPPK